MRGGAILPAILQALLNSPYICGSTKITDEVTAATKIEACDLVYNAVNPGGVLVAAGGRQVAIAGAVRAAAAAVAAGAGAGAGTQEQQHLAVTPNYVALYKSNGSYYTVNIEKAPGTFEQAFGAYPVVRPAPAPGAVAVNCLIVEV